jgi:ferrous iron transport protein A
MNLPDADVGETVTIQAIAGDPCFRRRLFELGLLPGTSVTVTGVAPLGDPLTLLARGMSLSLRSSEAKYVSVASASRSITG